MQLCSGLDMIRDHDLCNTGAVLNQLNYHAIRELVTLWVRNIPVEGEECKWPAPSWLDSSADVAMHWYCRGHGFKSRSGLNFFQGLILQLLITAMINHVFIFFSPVQIYHLSYIHITQSCCACVVNLELNKWQPTGNMCLCYLECLLYGKETPSLQHIFLDPWFAHLHFTLMF